MMPRWLALIFLIGMGALLLVYAHRARQAGEGRAGLGIGGAYTPNRDDNPIAFRFFLTLYYCGGIALCVWGLLVSVGMASPLRWQ